MKTARQPFDVRKSQASKRTLLQSKEANWYLLMKDDRKQHPEILSYEFLDSVNQSADTNDF